MEQVIDRSYMNEDQVIIYYSRKILDISNMHIACILTTQIRAKIFRDCFENELFRYVSTLKIDESTVIENRIVNRIGLQNNSSIIFLSKHNYDIKLKGFLITNIITDSCINLRDNLCMLRPI